MTNQTVSNNNQKNNPNVELKTQSNVFDGIPDLSKPQKEEAVAPNLSPTGKESLTTQRVEVPVIVYKDKFSLDFAIGAFFGVLITFVAIFAARKMFKQ